MYGVLLADGAVPRMPLPHCTPIQEEDEEPSGSPPPRGYPLRSYTPTPEATPSPRSRSGHRHKHKSILDPSKYSIQKSKVKSGQLQEPSSMSKSSSSPGSLRDKPFMGVLPAEEYLLRSSPIRTYPSQELPLEALLRPLPYAVHYISSQEGHYQVPRLISSSVPDRQSSPARISSSSPRRRGIITSPKATSTITPVKPEPEVRDFQKDFHTDIHSDTKEKKETKDEISKKDKKIKRTAFSHSGGAIDTSAVHVQIEEIGSSRDSRRDMGLTGKLDLPKNAGGRMDGRSPGCFGCISRKGECS